MKSAITIILFHAILIASLSLQAGTVKVCVEWASIYNDANMGEDYLTAFPSDRQGWAVPGVNVRVRIYRFNETENTYPRLYNGTVTLDSDGCATVPLVTAGLRLITVSIPYEIDIASGGRGIHILSDSATSWGTASGEMPVVTTYYDGAWLQVPGVGTKTIRTVIPQDLHSGLMPVASQMLKNAANFLIGNFRIHIASKANATLCPAAGIGAAGLPGSSGHIGIENGVHKICMDPGRNGQKYTPAHEIGHAISKGNDGPRYGGYEGDSANGAPSSVAFCADLNANAGRRHLFHSREFVGSAQKEGFSHFISIATFNDREIDPGLNSYLGIFVFGGSGTWRLTDTGTTPTAMGSNLPVHVTPGTTTGNYTRWTERICAPPVKYPHLAAERDWMNFFWGIYAADHDVRFEIAEITYLWKRANTGIYHTYCDPRNTVASWDCGSVKKSWTEWYSPCTTCTPEVTTRYYTKYTRGVSWEDVEDAAAQIYGDEDSAFYDPDKFQHLIVVGQKAGVMY